MPHFSLFGGAGNGRPSSPKHHHHHHQDAAGGKRWSYTTLAGLLSLLVVGYLAGTWHARLSLLGGPSDYYYYRPAASFTSCADSGELNFTAQHSSSGEEGETSTISSSTTTTSSGEYYTGPFPACDASLSEYTPCEDTQRSMAFPRARLVYRERHCPAAAAGELLRCLVPAPAGYKVPFRWPRSRDEAWYANVPHKHLTVEKAVQNWIQFEGDRFRFPGGGTMFPHGAGAYIDEIGAVVKLTSGDVRTALDTGCGVASFGAYLLDRQVLTMSFAPRDTHEAQVQFALERGVPAMLLTLASMRLPYPARAFDLAHCSRCLIPWQDYEGLYLLEVDRVLRPGGHWILSGPPINWPTHYQGWQRTQEDLKAEMDAIQDLAARMCWEKVAERGDLAVWRKPVNHQACKESKRRGLVSDKPAFCPADNNPDTAWYTPMEACITELPELGHHVGKLARWPARLTQVPPRIQTGALPSVTPESFRQDTELWRKRMSYYKEHLVGVLAEGRYRNVMDMNAGLGGFAANLDQDKTWVMNAVPPRTVSELEEDTLGVVYERGLIGTYQDWCEAFSTYPRTYDFIHADRLFTLYDNRCDLTYILLEMDRILRPEGAVLLRDHVDILTRVRRITSGMRWSCKLADHEDGPFNQEKILVCLKQYWVADPPAAQAQGDSKPHVVASDGGH